MLFHPHLHTLPQQIHFHYCAPAIGGIHKGFRLGAGAQQIFVSFLLIFEAAHKAAAGAGDLGGIQAQILGLCHFDGYRLEIVQEGGAAEGTTADA